MGRPIWSSTRSSSWKSSRRSRLGPAVNLVIYHGVLAPRARWRAAVVRDGRPEPDATAPTANTRPRCAWTWAALMHRVFAFDVLACPRCGGRLQVIAIVRDPPVVQALLAHGGGARSSAAPGPAPTRPGRDRLAWRSARPEGCASHRDPVPPHNRVRLGSRRFTGRTVGGCVQRALGRAVGLLEPLRLPSCQEKEVGFREERRTA